MIRRRRGAGNQPGDQTELRPRWRRKARLQIYHQLLPRRKTADVDDWKKLGRCIKYLRLTDELWLTLSANMSPISKWWIDGSFAVHPDMRSYTGGTYSLGKGSIYFSSTKQKLVTRSSTEAELVAVYGLLPQVLWTKYMRKVFPSEIKGSSQSRLLEKSYKTV